MIKFNRTLQSKRRIKPLWLINEAHLLLLSNTYIKFSLHALQIAIFGGNKKGAGPGQSLAVLTII